SGPWQHNCCLCTDATPHAWATTRGNRNCPIRVAELPGIQKTMEDKEHKCAQQTGPSTELF
ncbi:hypothetical protein K443DRAFT_681767, partial [Laccaria amethystina LaAM-08-1]